MSAIDFMHHTPGRLRLKSRSFDCSASRAQAALKVLHALPGVESARLNRHTGSITVRYDPSRLCLGDLLASLEDSGCLWAAKAQAAQPARLATGVADTFGKALVGALAQRTASRLIGALL